MKKAPFFLEHNLNDSTNDIKHLFCLFSFCALECDSQCSEEATPLEVPQPHVLTIGVGLVPVQKSSPEKRNQKEIVAGEERPKFLATTKTEDSQGTLIFPKNIN